MGICDKRGEEDPVGARVGLKSPVSEAWGLDVCVL